MAQRIRQGGQGSQMARRESVEVGQGRGKRRSTQTGREKKSWESPRWQRRGLLERPPRGLCPATAGVALTEDTEEGQCCLAPAGRPFPPSPRHMRVLLPTPPCLHATPFPTRHQATSRRELPPISISLCSLPVKGFASSRQVHRPNQAGCISNQTGSVRVDLSPDRYRCRRLSSMRRNHSRGLRG